MRYVCPWQVVDSADAVLNFLSRERKIEDTDALAELINGEEMLCAQMHDQRGR